MKLDYLGLVFKDINRRKFTSFHTLFAISLGIFAIFFIFLTSSSFSDSIKVQFEQFGTNRLYVTEVTTNLGPSVTGNGGLTDNTLELIESKAYVKKVYPYYSRTSDVKFGNEVERIGLFGSRLSEEFFNDLKVELDQGRFPKSNEKYAILIGPNTVDDIFDKKVSIGSNLYIKGIKFKVVGIRKSLGNPDDDSIIYAQLDTLREIYDEGDRVGIIDVIIQDGYDMTLAKENLKIFLDNKLGEDTTEITSPDQFLDQLNTILGIVNLTLGGIGFIALLVGAFGIINTMYVIITEKTKDIGIMKAIGATNSQVLFMYMFQSGMFGFLGAILGLFFGILGGIGFQALLGSLGYTFVKVSFSLSLMLSLLIFGFIIGVIAGYLPSKQASKLIVVECLRK